VTVRAQHIDDVAGAAARIPKPMRQPLVPDERRNRDDRSLIQVVLALAQRVPLYLTAVVEPDCPVAEKGDALSSDALSSCRSLDKSVVDLDVGPVCDLLARGRVKARVASAAEEIMIGPLVDDRLTPAALAALIESLHGWDRIHMFPPSRYEKAPPIRERRRGL
jgi:hypothetical protein